MEVELERKRIDWYDRIIETVFHRYRLGNDYQRESYFRLKGAS